MNHETDRRPLFALATGSFICVALVMALGLGKVAGTLDPLFARRGVGAMLGLMLMAAGNFVPKLGLFAPAAGAAAGDALDRFAGWTIVLCGVAFAAFFLWGPAGRVFIVPPSIVLAGFLAVLARWLMGKGRRAHPSLPLTPARRMLVTILVAVLWVCAIFLADAIWGDRVSRWLALPVPVVLILFSAIRARARNWRGGPAAPLN
jgi:hypothetical protein